MQPARLLVGAATCALALTATTGTAATPARPAAPVVSSEPSLAVALGRALHVPDVDLALHERASLGTSFPGEREPLVEYGLEHPAQGINGAEQALVLRVGGLDALGVERQRAVKLLEVRLEPLRHVRIDQEPTEFSFQRCRRFGDLHLRITGNALLAAPLQNFGCLAV